MTQLIEKEELEKSVSEIAETAGLEYVDDTMPGIQREWDGQTVKYIGVDGKIIKDPKEIQRINQLAIPPAYTNVWICPKRNGHLQATGRDAKGRKQYRYHTKWREVRDETKYTKMISFAHALPKIRAQVEQDLSLPGMPKEKVLATVVRLLECSLIRVGNKEYAKENHSYGLTTLKNRHVDITGTKLTFKFKGKSGKKHTITLNDRRLATVVRKCRDLPGQELFEYLDQDGHPLSISSTDVNQYLQNITNEHFTAKDFRTWAGTILAAFALQEFEAFDSNTQAKKNIVQAIEKVAKQLGNTPSVCRKSYIHPEVLDAYLDGSLLKTIKQQTEQAIAETLPDLKPEEAAILAFLQQRLTREIQKQKT